MEFKEFIKRIEDNNFDIDEALALASAKYKIESSDDEWEKPKPKPKPRTKNTQVRIAALKKPKTKAPFDLEEPNSKSDNYIDSIRCYHKGLMTEVLKDVPRMNMKQLRKALVRDSSKK